MILLDEHSGKIDLIKGFDSSDNWKSFLEKVNLEHKPIRIFGKKMMQPRLTGFFGEDGVSYQYSNQIMVAQAWKGWLKDVSDECSRITQTQFNSVLVNYYRNGQDSMGLHADNEKELGRNPSIASLSFGATRKMVFRENGTKKKLEINLGHGDLLLMSGKLQHCWKHEIPKTKSTEQGRLNLTFRRIINL